MTHASFFSGEGGFDLAAEWMGWENILHCEWNPFCQRILKYYWPNAYSYGNIKETDFTIHRGTIDILTGGFPCQPYSVAGKRLGKDDDRHLWPEMLRGIREIEPAWVVGENVRGLINWNGGLVFDEVQADLEALGYEVTPFILPACAVNAPHRRDRVWFVAFNAENAYSIRRSGNKRKKEPNKREQREFGTGNNELVPPNDAKTGNASNSNNNGSHGTEDRQSHIEGNDNNTPRQNATVEPSGCGSPTTGETAPDSPNTGSEGLQQGREDGIHGFEPAAHTSGERLPLSLRRQQRSIYKAERAFKRSKSSGAFTAHGKWERFPTQPPVCGRDDGLPTELDGITFSKWRNESIKAHGNAVVPQVPFEIFKVIEQMYKSNK